MIHEQNQALALHAEQDLLGALLAFGAEAMARIDCQLQPGHFFREDHGLIFGALHRILDAGRAVDVLTVADALEQAGSLEQVGGLAYLAELASATASPVSAHRHAEIVVERAGLRGLLAASDQIRALAEAPGDTPGKIDAAQKLVMELSERAAVGAGEVQMVGALSDAYLATLSERWDAGGGGMSTGFPDLDKRLGGGPKEGDLVILAGRPGMGKTALALQIAHHNADQGRGVLVFSQEMQAVQLIDRILSFVGRVPLEKILKGGMNGEEHAQFGFALQQINGLPLGLDEQGGISLDDVRRKTRKALRKPGFRLGLIVIDYLQLMAGKGGDNRVQELTAITGGLKALAKELKCAVLALSQLNRAVEQRPNKRPIMSDLRESGSIEQDADIILAPYRDDYYNPDSPHKGLAELLVLKNRQGAAGGFVPLAFRGECVRFESVAPGAWPDDSYSAPAKGRSRSFQE